MAAVPAEAAALSHQFDDRGQAKRRRHRVFRDRRRLQRQGRQTQERCSDEPHFSLGRERAETVQDSG